MPAGVSWGTGRQKGSPEVFRGGREGTEADEVSQVREWEGPEKSSRAPAAVWGDAVLAKLGWKTGGKVWTAPSPSLGGQRLFTA